MPTKDKEIKEDELPDNIVPVREESTGVAGTALQSGLYSEEYLSGLDYEEYDKMRRSDYQISRILRAIYTPILMAKFNVIPRDVHDKDQILQSEFKTKVLHKWMTKSWDETINEILTFLPFGYAVFEPTFHVIEDSEFGTITTIKDFGYRKQETIKEWYLTRDGKIDYIRQEVVNSDYPEDVKIKGDELLVFTNQKEGDNYKGISLLRSAYGPFKRKSLYLKIDMIGIEKMAIGTPIAYLSNSIWTDSKELSKISSVLSSYTSHQKQYVLLPDGLKDGGFEIKSGEYDSKAVNDSIKREDLAILGSVLQGFQAIGTQSMGGNAQSDGQMEMFLNSLDHICKYISSKIDDIVHQSYVMNNGEPKVRLHVRSTGISKKNLKELSEIITAYTKERVIMPDDTLERKVRDDLELPESEQSNVSREKEEPKKEDEVDKEETKETNKEEKLEDETESIELAEREMTDAEKRIDLKSIDRQFNASEKEYEEIIKDGIQKMESKYLADLKSALKQSNKSKAVMNIKVGHVVQLQKDITKFLNEQVEIGKNQAKKEIEAPKQLEEDDGVVKNLSSRIIFTAKTIASDIGQKVEEKGTFTSLNGIDDDLSNEQIVSNAEKEIDEYKKSNLAVASQGAVINQYVNTGRNNYFFSNKKLLQGFQYSAVLDGRTTLICRSLDKQTFTPTDIKSFNLRPPNHWSCRSILAPIRVTDPTVKMTGLKVTPVGNKSKADVLKDKQFNDSDSTIETHEHEKTKVKPPQSYVEDGINYHTCPIGTRVINEGKEYIKDYDGNFRFP